ncbi:Uncharacterised protein [Salmonella enterica subsp. enterica serovar Bovismorbificans]|uniref:Uncharacterized protein n=1 Tax=Salmonella enterica subsp. enterica serovar Bovismorbificans TaxID=58097 RepID=A0A655BN84_SALET|nr:Uncharacterised protein [Salmonella enterica subsp. enterica serovar Bovismorbificans]
MLRRNGSRQVVVAVTDILRGIFGRDVLKDHFKRGQTLA